MKLIVVAHRLHKNSKEYQNVKIYTYILIAEMCNAGLARTGANRLGWLAGWLDGGRQRRSPEPPKAVRLVYIRIAPSIHKNYYITQRKT